MESCGGSHGVILFNFQYKNVGLVVYINTNRICTFILFNKRIYYRKNDNVKMINNFEREYWVGEWEKILTKIK